MNQETIYTTRFQQFVGRNSGELLLCFTGMLSAFGQDGNILSLCCSTGEFLLQYITLCKGCSHCGSLSLRLASDVTITCCCWCIALATCIPLLVGQIASGPSCIIRDWCFWWLWKFTFYTVKVTKVFSVLVVILYVICFHKSSDKIMFHKLYLTGIPILWELPAAL
jgi:hypothetical protein